MDGAAGGYPGGTGELRNEGGVCVHVPVGYVAVTGLPGALFQQSELLGAAQRRCGGVGFSATDEALHGS